MKATLQSASGYQGNNMNLPVKDVNAAVPFYERYLGFTLELRTSEPQQSAVLGRDGIQIGLVENGGDPTQDGCAFRVDSIEAAVEEFKSRGLDRISGIKVETHDGATFRVFYLVAPDGL